MRNETKVGLVLILGVAVIVLGSLWLKGWSFGQEKQEVDAWFREVGQLMVGNPVKVRGVPIGEVSAIVLDQRSTGVAVRLRIDADIVLPDDPVVILSPESLFGDWQAEIFPRSRFPFYNYATSPVAGGVPGYSLPDVSRLTAVADRIAENLAVITERFDIAFTDETALNIREAIENIQEVSVQLTSMVQAQEETVKGLAAGLETTTATFQRAAETANRAFEQVEAAIAEGELTAIVDNIEAMTAQMDTLGRVLAEVSRELGNAVATADSSFSSLNAIMGDIERGEGSLGLLLQDTALYRDLVVTSTLIQDLLRDFQRNPQKYINLRVF